MRAQFVMSEVLIGLRRNITMTVAVIITVGIALGLVGAGLLLRKQTSTMKDFWYDKVEVSIFLKKDVSQEQREELQRELASKPEVEAVFYESPEQAYERFKEQFKDSPVLVENTTPDSLPESFRVKLKNPEEFDVLASEFANKPGVETVLNQRELLDDLFRVINGGQAVALIVAVTGLVAALILIGNTIRVAAFSRRRETGIMRLVGASNLYIQLPFLLEGALAGLIGAGIASLGLVALQAFFIDGVIRPKFRFTAIVGWSELRGVILTVIVCGVLMSAVASFVTIRKYLRV